MEQRQLRYFEAVARLGSLGQASEELAVATSAISRTITLLEAGAGIALFERTARGMALTDAGDTYLRYARAALLDVERLRSELDEVKGLRRGRVRIASIEAPAEDFVAKAIAEYSRSYPGLTLTLRVAGSELVTEALLAREVDIAITSNSAADPRLHLVEQVIEPLLAVMSPDYPIEEGHLSFEGILLNYPVAVPDHTFAIRRQLDDRVRRRRMVLAPALVANSLAALRGFARNGGGVTFLSALAIQADVDRGLLVGRALSDETFDDSTIELLVSAQRTLTPPVWGMLQQIDRELSGAGYLRVPRISDDEPDTRPRTRTRPTRDISSDKCRNAP